MQTFLDILIPLSLTAGACISAMFLADYIINRLDLRKL